MNPRLKKLIIIANIVAYGVICTGIYLKKKGGWKALAQRKKYTTQERIAMAQKGVKVPLAPEPKAPPPKKVEVAKAPPTKTPPSKKVEVAKAPPAARVPRVKLPAYIDNTKKMLEQMKVKEKTLRSAYYAGFRRDPFMPLIGIEAYLGSTKFTPDELAEYQWLSKEKRQVSSPFSLMGTIKSKGGESAIIVNNQILYKGDIVDGYKVADISRRKVTLKRGKKVINLEIPLDESKSGPTVSVESEGSKSIQDLEGKKTVYDSDIRGTVWGPEGNVLEEVIVELHSEDGYSVYKEVTNSKGRFHIYAPPGNYTLVIDLFGYKTYKEAVTLSSGHTTIFVYSISLERL